MCTSPHTSPRYIGLNPQACLETSSDGRTPLHCLCANATILLTPIVAGRVETRKRSRRSREMRLYRLRTGRFSYAACDSSGGGLPLMTAPLVSPLLLGAMYRAAPDAARQPDRSHTTPVDVLLENAAYMFHSTDSPRTYLDQIGVGGMNSCSILLPRATQRALRWLRLKLGDAVGAVGARRGAAQHAPASSAEAPDTGEDTDEQNVEMVDSARGNIAISTVTASDSLRRDRGAVREERRKTLAGERAIRTLHDEERARRAKQTSEGALARSSDFVMHSYEAATAARLHDIWKEPRRVPDDERQQRRRKGLPPLEFKPRVKMVGRTLYDIANLDFWELPVPFRRSNIQAANQCCRQVRAAAKRGQALDNMFINDTAREAHARWISIAENRASASEEQLLPFDALSEAEKDKNRVIAEAAVAVWCVHVRLWGSLHRIPMLQFLRSPASLSHSLS